MKKMPRLSIFKRDKDILLKRSFFCFLSANCIFNLNVLPWSFLVVGDEGWIGPSRKLLSLC